MNLDSLNKKIDGGGSQRHLWSAGRGSPPRPTGAQMRPNGRRFHSRLIGGFLTPLGMFNTVEREEGGGAASRDSIAPPPCLLRLCLCRLIDFDSFFSVTATAVLLLASRLPPPTSPLPLPPFSPSLFLSFFFLSIFLADLDVKLIFRCESSFCFPGIGRSGGRGKGGEGGREFFEFYGIFMGSLWDLNIF